MAAAEHKDDEARGVAKRLEESVRMNPDSGDWDGVREERELERRKIADCIASMLLAGTSSLPVA
jgi:hypothetical protein